MGPRNNQVVDNPIVNGQFYVKDYTSCLKGAANRKCNILLSFERDGLVTIQLTNVESSRTTQDKEFNETILLQPEKWVVYLSQTVDSMSLLLVKLSPQLSHRIAFEAKNEKISVLKIMEIKLREFLRVISYDVRVRDITTKKKPVAGSLHIMRNKLLVLVGSPPNLKTLLDHTFGRLENEIMLFGNEGLCFAELPNSLVSSDHTEDVWKTVQGCVQAVAFTGTERDTSTKLGSTPSTSEANRTNEQGSLELSENTIDPTDNNNSLFSTAVTPETGASNPTFKYTHEAKTQYTYHNLPKRPCKYIYMNLPNKRKAPQLNHDYINVFHMGSVYQNCWRSCTKPSDEELTDDECTPPPPPPPRQKPPPLPPRPLRPRNRPPNSPLPPLPHEEPCFSRPPPLPRRLHEPPPLPSQRSPKRSTHKEIQYVVYSSKPVIGQIFVIQVVFFQKNDYATLQKIKELEEEANYQVLKPLPDCISVSGDLNVSLENIDDCCTLKSEEHQVIEHEIVKEAILQSCWLIIEFHLEHNDLSSRRNFHGKIIMKPKGISKGSFSRSTKEIQISTTFQDSIQNGLHSPSPLVCNSLKTIGVRKYLDVCSLMDIPCALHNDWTGLAGEVGLTVDEVFKIQSKACFPNFSPTNEVLNIWSQRQSKSCNIDEFKIMLKNLQRFDVLETLEEPYS